MSTVENAVFQDRRGGYHPCDYETYLALKDAHKLYLRAYRDDLKWKRWDRKTVRRVGPEPALSPFVLRGDDPAPIYHELLDVYRRARRPVEKPEDVVPIPPILWRETANFIRAHYAFPTTLHAASDTIE
jgi:hypothetical protein